MRPGFIAATSGGNSPERPISLPSIFRMTSPGSIPALAAGLPFCTELTSAPFGLLRPKLDASA